MRLTNADPRFSIAIKPKMHGILEGGCVCGSASATLRKRNTGAGHVTIHLQCDGCGKSLGGALARREFYYWQDFPVWDQALADVAANQGDADWQAHRIELEAHREDRRQAYAVWLAHAPEWKALRLSVLERARYVCEGCLNARAYEVHHTTYAFGKIPPAWELRAVCQSCHRRLHEEWAEGERNAATRREVDGILGR